MATNYTIDLSDRVYKLATILLGVVAIFIIGAAIYNFQSLPGNTPHEISVTGQGKAYAKPDVAIMSFGVTTEAAKSQDAVTQNTEKMNAVIKAIKDQGVEDKDIQTTLYSLNPVYGYDKAVAPMATEPSMPAVYPVPGTGTPRITGYSLQQQVQVKMRNFDKINVIIDQATAQGANSVGSLQFTVDDIEKIREEARSEAINEAKAKAKALSKQSGLWLGRLVNVSEGYNAPMPYATMQDKAVGSGPEIQAGQLQIDANVTLTYRVR